MRCTHNIKVTQIHPDKKRRDSIETANMNMIIFSHFNIKAVYYTHSSLFWGFSDKYFLEDYPKQHSEYGHILCHSHSVHFYVWTIFYLTNFLKSGVFPQSYATMEINITDFTYHFTWYKFLGWKLYSESGVWIQEFIMFEIVAI